MVNIDQPLIGDLVWLFYYDRFGIFKIISAIVRDYQFQGKYPITHTDPTVISQLEDIINAMNTGTWPNVRDRDSTYLRCLGWSLRQASSADTGIQINYVFGNQFHKFIQLATIYYSEKQVAVAIRGAARVSAPPSFATEAAIRDTLDRLKRSFESYLYGRNQLNTTRGVAAVFLNIDVTEKLRSSIGIPSGFNTPEQYLPAAYDILVLKRSPNPSTVKRYKLHQDLAESANNILLQIDALDTSQNNIVAGTSRTELSLMLDNVESLIETYRTAYKEVTGVDLGKVTPEVMQELKMVA
jgi:hypothetical protein